MKILGNFVSTTIKESLRVGGSFVFCLCPTGVSSGVSWFCCSVRLGAECCGERTPLTRSSNGGLHLSAVPCDLVQVPAKWRQLDSKSGGAYPPCGFDSHLQHHSFNHLQGVSLGYVWPFFFQLCPYCAHLDMLPGDCTIENLKSGLAPPTAG